VCLRKANDTRRVVRETDMLGLNQDTVLGAFRERAERVHSGKRQTINRPFFHLDIPIRKQAIH